MVAVVVVLGSGNGGRMVAVLVGRPWRRRSQRRCWRLLGWGGGARLRRGQEPQLLAFLHCRQPQFARRGAAAGLPPTTRPSTCALITLIKLIVTRVITRIITPSGPSGPSGPSIHAHVAVRHTPPFALAIHDPGMRRLVEQQVLAVLEGVVHRREMVEAHVLPRQHVQR